MFFALISAETHRYESNMDLNALWNWELGDYILSFHFPVELFLLFKLKILFVLAFHILFFNTKFYPNNTQKPVWTTQYKFH